MLKASLKNFKWHFYCFKVNLSCIGMMTVELFNDSCQNEKSGFQQRHKAFRKSLFKSSKNTIEISLILFVKRWIKLD